MYRVSWAVGENDWGLGGPLFNENCHPSLELAEEGVPQMMHQPQKLKKPAQISLDTLEDVEGGAYIL